MFYQRRIWAKNSDTQHTILITSDKELNSFDKSSTCLLPSIHELQTFKTVRFFWSTLYIHIDRRNEGAEWLSPCENFYSYWMHAVSKLKSNTLSPIHSWNNLRCQSYRRNKSGAFYDPQCITQHAYEHKQYGLSQWLSYKSATQPAGSISECIPFHLLITEGPEGH